jgi:hypothetical protein
MPWPVQSESFIRTNAPGVWVTYTVPEGERIVVKNVQMANPLGQAGVVAVVRVHGYQIVYHAFQAPVFDKSVSCHVVAYERETVQAYVSASQIVVCVSGFCFQDPGPGDPPPVTYEPLPPIAGQLPAEGIERE